MLSQFNHKNAAWKTEEYWSLPENVRLVIDKNRSAAPDGRNSDFYNKLDDLTDRIHIYKSMFYSNVPKHEKHFLMRKQDQLIKEKAKKEAQLRRRLAGRIHDFAHQRRAGIRLDPSSVSPSGNRGKQVPRGLTLMGLDIGQRILRKNGNTIDAMQQ